jgi:hypothetical protein
VPESAAPGFGLDAELHVAHGYLEGAGKGAQDLQRPPGALAHTFDPAQLHQQPPQWRHQHLRQPACLRRLEDDREVVLLVCELRDAIEKDGLADAAQPQQHLAARGTSPAHPLQHHGRVLDDLVAPGEFRRRVPAPGANGLVVGSISSLRSLSWFIAQSDKSAKLLQTRLPR